MGLVDRLMGKKRSAPRRADFAADTEHLVNWAAARRGVEAFVEPRTTVTETTVVLIAHDGEWTRRRVAGGEAARRLGKRLGIPMYDVGKVGYPQRMRDYTARQRILRERNDDSQDGAAR
ncbi:MAG TPA: oxidoreductase [Pseudonocardiaceae bacterium]